jgi:hypothetical protein
MKRVENLFAGCGLRRQATHKRKVKNIHSTSTMSNNELHNIQHAAPDPRKQFKRKIEVNEIQGVAVCVSIHQHS